jgi:hypothetical protein
MNTSRRNYLACLGWIVLFLSVTNQALGQPPQEPQKQIPTFRASVQLVQLDVVVTDANGDVVTGLGPDDFRVWQDGKPQVVKFAEFVRAAVVDSHHPRAAASDVIEEHRPAEGTAGPRKFVIVVDDWHMSFEAS